MKKLFPVMMTAFLIIAVAACSHPRSRQPSSGYSDDHSSAAGIPKVSAAASRTFSLSQPVSGEHFSLSIPPDWKITELRNAGFCFGKESADDAGGIYTQEYDVSAGESMPDIKALLNWMLPNHADVTKTERLEGLSTDAYLMSVTTEQPAAAGGNVTGTWTYIVFLDQNRTTAAKFAAYELFGNTKYALEQELLKMAETFKIS